MRSVTAIGSLCVASLLSGQSVEKRGRELVTRIDVEFPKYKPKFGGGILFARSQGHLFMVTAKHVVRDDNTPPAAATKVTVTFGNSRKTQGTILPDLKTDLDMAVVSVKDEGLFPDLFPASVIPEAEDFERSTKVYAVGHPYGVSWDIPVIPDEILELKFPLVRFQSNFIRVGNSGGALMNAQGLIVGMVIEDVQPTGIAINFPSVLTTLLDNGYRTHLRPHWEERLVQSLISDLKASGKSSYELDYLNGLKTWVRFEFGPIDVSRCKITLKSNVLVGDAGKTVALATDTSAIDLSPGGSVDVEHRRGSDLAASVLGSPGLAASDKVFSIVVLRAGKLAFNSTRSTETRSGEYNQIKDTKVTQRDRAELVFSNDASAESFQGKLQKLLKYCEVVSRKE